MSMRSAQAVPRVASAVYALLNPVPYGFFVAALVFDATYARSGDVLWVKSAAWLITLGLLFAIVPRLINLFHVWRPSNRSTFVAKADFWLNLVAILAAIANAFVHSRDAYGTMPEGLLLSILTVLLLASGCVFVAVQRAAFNGGRHE